MKHANDKKTILGILDESMNHFTIGNAVAGLNLVWHFLFKDAKVKIIKQFLDIFSWIFGWVTTALYFRKCGCRFKPGMTFGMEYVNAKRTILGILDESMNHFTIGNVVASLNSEWHFYLKMQMKNNERLIRINQEFWLIAVA
jgi:hypothetical protein